MPPRTVPRPEHSISRAEISNSALKVLYRLRKGGYQAFIVGGGVRDLLLGQHPKDFDVVTDAHPEQVRELFHNCRLIGRRFRLAHIHFGREVVEVATFRAARELDGGDANGDERMLDEDGRIIRDNIYGSIDEDVWRRDFTANALYYNIEDYSLWDYVGGVEDVEARVLRLIGDPETRYREDPVRMLRAVRFAAKLGFQIHEDTERPLAEFGYLLENVPPARLFDELLKLLLSGYARASLQILMRYDLLRYVLPHTDHALVESPSRFQPFLDKALADTDARVSEGKPVTPTFLFAVLLWGPIRLQADVLETQGYRELPALAIACDDVTTAQQSTVSLPRRYAAPLREIVLMQPRFARRDRRNVMRLLEHRRFRAAYDLMLLRRESGDESEDNANWWTRIQTLSPEALDQELQSLRPRGAGKRRRRRRRPRKKPHAGQPA